MRISRLRDSHGPARLHLGFLDLNGGLGRRFGSLGLASTAARRGWSSARRQAAGERAGAARALRHLDALASASACDAACICHRGGNPGPCGSRLRHAAGARRRRGLRRLQWPRARRRRRRLLDRGARSGIGIATFRGRRGARRRPRRADTPPPIIAPPAVSRAMARAPDPRSCRQGLTAPRRRRPSDVAAISREAMAAELCRLRAHAALPALAEHDFRASAPRSREMQAAIGDYFAPVQGGAFVSPPVASVLAWLAAEGSPASAKAPGGRPDLPSPRRGRGRGAARRRRAALAADSGARLLAQCRAATAAPRSRAADARSLTRRASRKLCRMPTVVKAPGKPAREAQAAHEKGERRPWRILHPAHAHTAQAYEPLRCEHGARRRL